MPSRPKKAKPAEDPSQPIRERASEYPGVDQGTACTQSSFKAGKKSFLFIGMQGGRHKAMFKLDASLPQAAELAEREPDRFQVGSTAWVTARFTAEEPLPKRLWRAWLDESYAISTGQAGGGKAAKAKSAKKTAKKTAKKSAVQQPESKSAARKKRATKKPNAR